MLCSFPTLEEALRVAEIREDHRRALSDGTAENVQGRWLERKCLHLRRWFLCRCWFSCIGFIGFFVGTITTTLWGGRPGKRKWSCCTGGGCDGILCMCAVRSDRHLGMFFGKEKLMQLVAEVLGLVILRQPDLDILLLFFFGGVAGGNGIFLFFPCRHCNLEFSLVRKLRYLGDYNCWSQDCSPWIHERTTGFSERFQWLGIGRMGGGTTEHCSTTHDSERNLESKPTIYTHMYILHTYPYIYIYIYMPGEHIDLDLYNYWKHVLFSKMRFWSDTFDRF